MNVNCFDLASSFDTFMFQGAYHFDSAVDKERMADVPRLFHMMRHGFRSREFDSETAKSIHRTDKVSKKIQYTDHQQKN